MLPNLIYSGKPSLRYQPTDHIEYLQLTWHTSPDTHPTNEMLDLVMMVSPVVSLHFDGRYGVSILVNLLLDLQNVTHSPRQTRKKHTKFTQSKFIIFFLHKPFSVFYKGNCGQKEKIYIDLKIFTQTWFAGLLVFQCIEYNA